MPSVSCSDLSFHWPDGTPVLADLCLSLGPGRSGVIGSNGAGKTTLLRLIAGALAPTGGSVRVDGMLGHLPQHLPLQGDARVDEVLGIAATRAALHDIEAGTVDEHRLAQVGDDWDVEERARATLDRLGLVGVGLDRTVGTLSGGEATLLGLAARLLARPDVLLLDEPTNNLDLAHRRHLYKSIAGYDGVLLVVTHDRALLDRVHRVVEVRDGAATAYGGNLDTYEEVVAREQEAAHRAVRAAEADLRRQRRELAEARTKLDRRLRMGRKQEAEARYPKVVAHERKRQAQVSAGKLRATHEGRLANGQARLAAAEEAVRATDPVRIDLPGTAVPPRRLVLTCSGVNVAPPSPGRQGEGPPEELWTRAVTLAVRGPERVALLGPNGGGKTSLLRCIAGRIAPSRGHVELGVAGLGYLPQRLDVLDPRRSVLDNVRRTAPTASEDAVRARLARFAFRGDAVDQPAATLSGGERFRAVLASLLCAEPPPQLLLLDEPTNNLDLHAVDQLCQALADFRGALLIASHDLPFLSRIGIDRWLHLDRAGLTT